MKDTRDVLVIRKENFSNDDYMKMLKVPPELHARVRQLADETKQPISKVSCALVEFALNRVVIEE